MVIAYTLCFFLLMAHYRVRLFTSRMMLLTILIFVVSSLMDNSKANKTERCLYANMMLYTNSVNKVEVEWHKEGDWRTQYTVIGNIELLGKRPRDGIRLTDRSGNKFDVEYKNIGEVKVNGRDVTIYPIVE